MKIKPGLSLFVLCFLVACWPRPEAESQQQDVVNNNQPAVEDRWPDTVRADYAGVPVNDYLAGRFSPAGVSAFVSLAQAGVPNDGRGHYLRREAAAALKNMIDDYCAQHPGSKIWVVSATRAYNDQKYIWEGKWNGTILVNGQRLNQTIPDPETRALEILKYSSMPGTSRHHWGTDVDLNNLTNEYFEQGQGKVLYDWLVANAGRYGFGQPYTAGRKEGYNEEKWHWSYLPLSIPMTRDWLKIFGGDGGDLFRKGAFAGSEVLAKYGPVYVGGINPALR